MDYLAELTKIFSRIAVDAPLARRASLLADAKDFFAGKSDSLKRMSREGAGGAAVVAANTALADAVVASIYGAAIKEADAPLAPHSLVALGGYGRKELCFCSDLDISLVHEGELDENLKKINDYVLHFLWDLGFRVGHSVRSIEESLALADRDDIALTAMLEGRPLAGGESTFENLSKRLLVRVRSAGVERFVRRLEKERSRNRREAGDEIYHSTPNIKHTAGGLRDYHTGVWIALARFGIKSPRKLFQADLLTEEHFLGLEKALDFAWRVRNQVYLDGGSPADVLTHGRQERIAQTFGYRDSRGALAVELFMQDYYVNALELQRFYDEMLRLGGLARTRRAAASVPRGGRTERGLRIAHRQVYLPARGADWLVRRPSRLIEAIWYSQKHGFTLSESAREGIEANLDLIDERFREDPVARDFFLAILSDPLRAGASIRLMNDLGVLDRYLPEYAAIRNVVRYHQFHRHPVHEHTLRALDNIASIPHLSEPGSDVLKRVLSEIEAPEILTLAVILHDLGKAREGEHIEAGVRVAETVGDRLALDAEQMRALRFLVGAHIEMTHISRSRDLEDPEIIRAFASRVGSMENLNMLYLLTFADLKAVRQGAWSDWISALLYRLYSGARDALAGPSGVETRKVDRWNTPKAAAVCEYLRGKDPLSVRQHLKGMSERYLVSFSPKEIADHMKMASSLRDRGPALKWAAVPEYSLSRITVCTADRPGVFAEMVGVFASQQVSVLDAAAFTRADGVAIDSFHVVDGRTEGPLSSQRWAVVKQALRTALGGGRDIEPLIRRAEQSPLAAQKTMPSLRRGVSFDNAASKTCTIIDVEAPDRIGLLYDIASAIFDLGLDMSVARIATDGRQARDAFYVTDRGGEKIDDPLRLEEIEKKIKEALDTGLRGTTVAQGQALREPHQSGVRKKENEK